MKKRSVRIFSLQINSKESQSKIARITVFVAEVKKMNSLLISFCFSFSLSFPLFLFSLSSYSHHPCSRSRLPHSRLPLHPVQPLPTIRRTITFRSTTLPTSSSLYSRACFCFPESSSIIDSEISNKKVLLQTRCIKCKVLRLSIVSHTLLLNGNDYLLLMQIANA